MATSTGMNRRQMLLALGGLASGGLLLSGTSQAADGDKKIALAKVPAKIKAAADKAVPGAEWSEATKSTEDGEVAFRLEGDDAKGRYVWVEVAADGTVNEVQTEIPLKEAPAAVRAALKAKMPRFKVTTVYEARQNGKVVRFDFEGKRPKNKEVISISFSPDGKPVEDDS
jgi:hypothetical protein